MGLLVEFSIYDLGFPEVIEQEIDGEIISEAPDYGSACDAFVETFLDVARTLVPVDTGYLKSTIDAGSDGSSYCWGEAMAEYAQYVEYGTSYMDAQPYFEPALEEALMACATEAQIARDEAQAWVDEQVQAILESMMEASMSAAAAGGGDIPMMGMGGGSFGSFLGGLLMFAGMALLMFPLLVNIYGILDTFASALMGRSSRSSTGGIDLPEVQIID